MSYTEDDEIYDRMISMRNYLNEVLNKMKMLNSLMLAQEYVSMAIENSRKNESAFVEDLVSANACIAQVISRTRLPIMEMSCAMQSSDDILDMLKQRFDLDKEEE